MGSPKPRAVQSRGNNRCMKVTNGVLAFVVAVVALLPAQRRPLLAQAGNVPQPGIVIDDPEAYAVYASVLPARFSSGDNDLTHVALLQETRANMDCLPKFGPEWNPVLESYKIENSRVRTLLPGFTLGLPYTLISSAELNSLRAAGGAPTEPVFARFPNGKILSLSAVGFDKSKTRALVTISYDCGFDCGGGWHVLREKDGGRWGQPKGNVPTCTWMS
jgi:hypothetical protein